MTTILAASTVVFMLAMVSHWGDVKARKRDALQIEDLKAEVAWKDILLETIQREKGSVA